VPLPPSRTALVVAFATIYLVWGSTYLGIRVAVETLPPFLMAGMRFLVAGSLLLAFQRLRGPLNLRPHHWRDNAIVGTFLLLGGNGLVSWAELSLPSGVTALIIGSQPLIMVLTEWAWPGGVRPE
jgi:drug/metabolite transporter (DMT)-like permease